MIEPEHEELSVREQCELLGLHRSTLYYQRRPQQQENETLMRRIDELHTAHITRGSRKIRDALRQCGAEMKVIAMIEDPDELGRILQHLVKIGRSPPGFDPDRLN